ncbi:MAG: class II glutamine amidotransferase [Proteobacteria bacterium]|nr:class II glutamine amidotransferase [Pseudomonadota bacterium]
MGFLLACMASRADRLAELLTNEMEALGQAPARTNGWGLGFYQSGEVLHKKHPQPSDEPIDWIQAIEGVRSHCVIAHARAIGTPECRAENTHPFRMRQWLFAHSGDVDRFEVLKPRLLETMPDFIRRNIRGSTDSEHLFHTILSFVHDSGQLDSPDAQDQTVTMAVRSAVRLVDRLTAEVGGEPGNLNLVITNGRHLYALCRGGPMALLARESEPQPRDAPEEAATSDVASLRRGFRYTLLASGLEQAPVGYQTMRQGCMATVDRDFRVNLEPL